MFFTNKYFKRLTELVRRIFLDFLHACFVLELVIFFSFVCEIDSIFPGL